MNDLTKQTKENISGFYKLQLIDVGKPVYKFPPHINYEIQSNIELEDGVNIALDVYFTPQSLTPSDGEGSNNKGDFYNHTIKFFHPKDLLINLQTIEEYKSKKFFAILTSVNGDKKVFGTPEFPLTLTAKRATPSSHSALTGWNIELKGLNKEPSLFFNGSIVYVTIS